MNNSAKKIIFIFILIMGILVSGIFTVDERQNAVVTNRVNQQTIIYAAGLHFSWPVLTKVRYVFINQRTAAFNFKFVLSDNTPVALTCIVFWKVTNPELFLQKSISLTPVGFSKALSETVKQIVSAQIKGFSLNDLNQHNLLLNQTTAISNLGIVLDSITVDEIGLSALLVAPVVESGVKVPESAPVDAGTLAIESAYYQAQAIKTQAEIEQAGMYREIQIKDPQFYDYFRKLQIYKNSAKSKQEMPRLEDLYSN